MKPTLVTELTLTKQARDTLRAAARASTQKERGGILVGYLTIDTIRIEDALQVADTTAARTHYVRRSAAANELLTNYLSAAADPYLGYVGEWHTHPAPIPPSPTDRNAMRRMASRNRRPVALVVAALQHDQRNVWLHGLASDPTSIAARMVGKHHEVPTTHP